MIRWCRFLTLAAAIAATAPGCAPNRAIGRAATSGPAPQSALAATGDPPAVQAAAESAFAGHPVARSQAVPAASDEPADAKRDNGVSPAPIPESAGESTR